MRLLVSKYLPDLDFGLIKGYHPNELYQKVQKEIENQEQLAEMDSEHEIQRLLARVEQLRTSSGIPDPQFIELDKWRRLVRLYCEKYGEVLPEDVKQAEES